MDILKRQLLSARYIQHSARVLFVIAQAGAPDRAQILDAIFDLSREEILKGVEARTLGKIALNVCSTIFRVSPNHLLWILEGLVDGEVHNRIVVPRRPRALDEDRPRSDAVDLVAAGHQSGSRSVNRAERRP